MIISVDVDAPTSSDRKVSWVVGGIFAAIVFSLVAMWSLQQTPDPQPSPLPNRVLAPLSEDQQTYVLYASWLQSEAFAECMNQRGFPREAVAGTERSKVRTVAAHLGVTPTQPESWLAPAEARSGRSKAAPGRADDLYVALKDADDGGCQVPREPSDPNNAAKVAAAIRQAANDQAFTAYLAEAVWLADEPAYALLYQTHVLMAAADGDSPVPSDRWANDLAAAIDVITSSGPWTAGPTEGYEDFAQGVAIADDGSLLVVRVGDPTVIESGFVSNIGRPAIDCGTVGVVLGTGALQPQATDASGPYAELTANGCAALR